MGMISNALYRITRLLLEEQGSDPDITATRWQLFAKSLGLYSQSPAGDVLRLLTSADLSDLQAADIDLGIIAALTPVSGKFLVGRSSAWTNDFILTTDIPDISATYQPRDSDLDALAGLTSAADKLPYFTGSHAAALADLTTFGRSLIDDADASTARTTLGSVIGTNVQAYDDDLAALAALTTTGFAKRTGANTWTLNNLASTDLSDFTEAVQDVVGAFATNGANISITYNDGANTLTFAVTGIGTTLQAWDADLDAVAALSSTGIVRRTGAGTFAAGATSSDISDFTEAAQDAVAAALTNGSNITITYSDSGNTITIDVTGQIPVANGGTAAATAGAARTNLGLAIGTNVQAWDNDLDLVAALTGGGIPKRTSGNTWSLIGGEVFLTAAGGTPSLTNGCAPSTKWETASNKEDVWSLDFDASAIEYAQWTLRMPAVWNGSTFTYEVLWTAASGVGDAVFTLEARAYANDDVLDGAWGTGVDVTDTLTAVGDMDISPTSGAVTSAAVGALAGGNLVQFRLSRKATAGGDTLAVDARVLGLTIYFGIN